MLAPRPSWRPAGRARCCGFVVLGAPLAALLRLSLIPRPPPPSSSPSLQPLALRLGQQTCFRISRSQAFWLQAPFTFLNYREPQRAYVHMDYVCRCVPYQKLEPGQPGWLSGLAPPSAQGLILETRDQVPRRAPCMEPASPSACVSISLSLMNR